MELEFRIQTKRQELQALLNYSLAQNPTFLPLIRQIKDEILLCNQALRQLHRERLNVRHG